MTTVPAQALFLLNSDFSLDASEDLARRLLGGEEASDAERVGRAFRLCLSRPPLPAEMDEALAFLHRARGQLEGREKAERRVHAWAGFCQALLSSAEFR